MAFWDAYLQRLMREALVPGAALAIVRNGHIDELASYGFRSVQSLVPVDEHSIFAAALLSKPVFAYLVLRLVDQGRLQLDTQPSTYLPDYLPADARSSSITLAQALSHSGGLPNWRSRREARDPRATPGV